MFNTLLADFRIIFERDPAARNWLEVLTCYPGFQALVFHRIAHSLYFHKVPFLPRLISHIARFLTGIEIHPGAVIGQGVFIDHGMGVVIGETAIIGDSCLIYQGVTLGGTGKETGKRHPTLGENVVVGGGAKILGNINIGSNVRIGASSVVLKDVPPNCTVVGIPGRVVDRSGVKVNPLEHGSLPDSEAKVMRALFNRINSLEEQVQLIKILQCQEPELESVVAKPHLKSFANHSNYRLTDLALFNRINYLEEQVKLIKSLQSQLLELDSTVAKPPLKSSANNYSNYDFQDLEIQDFFDGSGI